MQLPLLRAGADPEEADPSAYIDVDPEDAVLQRPPSVSRRQLVDLLVNALSRDMLAEQAGERRTLIRPRLVRSLQEAANPDQPSCRTGFHPIRFLLLYAASIDATRASATSRSRGAAQNRTRASTLFTPHQATAPLQSEVGVFPSAEPRDSRWLPAPQREGAWQLASWSHLARFSVD